MRRVLFSLLVLFGVGIAAGQFHPATGTVFSESPGNIATNPLLCYAGGTGAAAACQQTWTVATGITQSVGACPTGFTAVNCFTLPASSTAVNEIDAFGTMPCVPQGSTTTCPGQATSNGCSVVTAEFEYTSTTHGAFRPFFELQTIGAANQAATWEWNSNGTNSAFFNTAGAVTMAINAHHVIVVNLCGASSFVSIDGGAHTTFTAPAFDYYEMRLMGDNTASGATEYWGNITITTSTPTLTGGWPLSMFMDNHSQTLAATVTPATLAAGSLGVTNAAWAQTGSGVTYAYDNTFSCTFPSAVTAGGSTSTGNGLMIEATFSIGEAGDFFLYEPSTTVPAASASICYGTDANPATVTFVDQFGVGAGGPAVHVCGSNSATASQCPGTLGTFLMLCGEQRNGQTVGCTQIQNLPQLYIITGEVSATGTDYMDIYAWPSLSHLTGNSSGLGCAFAGHTFCMTDSTSGQLVGVQIGALGSEVNVATFHSWYGNLQFNMMNLNGNAIDYPLLPPSASFVTPGGPWVIMGSN